LERPADRLTHAGGVVYRRRTGEPDQVLLVRGRTGAREWVLPKGHIEPGETPAQTARREVSEEAGVDAEVGAELGRSDFVAPNGKTVAVLFFLMPYRGLQSPTESRDILWCAVDDAIRLTPFEDLRALLRQARRMLTQE
jgi:8-oxo-dGTP pyrophosphatase MutT (NUDIX family)